MKILAIILFALVGTLILNGPIQSYADPQLDALLQIATKARENLQVNISQINNVPDEIKNLFKKGSDETDALSNAINENDIASAKQHFLSAMNFFKTTNDKINSLNATQVNNQQALVSQLQDEITRVEKIEQTLKTITITNNANFDFTQFDQLIQQAKQDLDTGNTDQVSKSIEAANQIVVNAHHFLTTIAKQRTPDRAKDFTEKQIERLNKTGDLNISQNALVQTPEISTLSKTNSNLTSQENPLEMIAKIRKLISEGNTDEALKMIKSLEAHQKEKLKTSENSTQTQPPTNTNIQNNTTSVNSTTINPSPPVGEDDSKKFHLSSNATKSNPIKTDSFHHITNERNGNVEINKTDSNPIKTDSFHHITNERNGNVEINKTDSNPIKTDSFHHITNERNGNVEINKTDSMVPKGSLSSDQQNNIIKNKNHEKNDFGKQKNEKRNHILSNLKTYD